MADQKTWAEVLQGLAERKVDLLSGDKSKTAREEANTTLTRWVLLGVMAVGSWRLTSRGDVLLGIGLAFVTGSAWFGGFASRKVDRMILEQEMVPRRRAGWAPKSGDR